jgi:hypothetical protein
VHKDGYEFNISVDWTEMAQVGFCGQNNEPVYPTEVEILTGFF